MVLRTETEIPAPPAEVMRVILDVARWPEWHSALIKSCKPVNGAPDLITAKPGDVLNCDFGIFSTRTTVSVKTENELRWVGKSFLGSGEHFFEVQDSKANLGGTLFTHGESQTGLLKVLLAESSPLFGIVRARFQQFDEDLRGQVAQRRKNPASHTVATVGVPVAHDDAAAPPAYPAGGEAAHDVKDTKQPVQA